MDDAALTAFLREGTTALDTAQFLQTLTAWTIGVTATIPAPSRLLIQVLCRIEEAHRNSVTLNGTWANLWQHLECGDPPPLAEVVTPLVAAALVAVDPADSTDPNTPVRYRIHPGIAETSTPRTRIRTRGASVSRFSALVASPQWHSGCGHRHSISTTSSPPVSGSEAPVSRNRLHPA